MEEEELYDQSSPLQFKRQVWLSKQGPYETKIYLPQISSLSIPTKFLYPDIKNIDLHILLGSLALFLYSDTNMN